MSLIGVYECPEIVLAMICARRSGMDHDAVLAIVSMALRPVINR